MISDLLSDVEQDQDLYRAVEPVLAELSSLNAQQIETLIFYLKALHAEPPHADGDPDHYRRFDDLLGALRTSKSQNELLAKAHRLMFVAIGAGAVAGIGMAIGAFSALGGARGLGIALVVSAAVLLFVAGAVFGIPALVAAKVQERRYFLDCLRASRSCSELDWSGLFSHNGVTQPGPQSDSDLRRTEAEVSEIALQLRTALYVDRSWRFSHLRLRADS